MNFIKQFNRSVLFCAIAFISAGNGAAQDTTEATRGFERHTGFSRREKAYRSEPEHNSDPNDFTPRGFVKQPSFVRGAGLLNKNEHALVMWADGDLIPVPIMAGYRYGLVYWWDVGFDIGGNAGVFEALARTRIENLKTRRTEAFIWSNEFLGGYKVHRATLSDSVIFDDRSLVLLIDNSVSLRLGAPRRAALFFSTIFYMDYDLSTPRRQTDYYLGPILLGFEAMAGDHGSFFIEVGAAYSINGMQIADGRILYEKSWFPVFRMGTALRTGSKTAIYYTRETKELSRARNGRLLSP